MPDIREHVVECDAKGDDHEDVGKEREWYEVFELTDLTGQDEGSKDEEHIPQDVDLVVWEVVVKQLKQEMGYLSHVVQLVKYRQCFYFDSNAQIKQIP